MTQGVALALALLLACAGLPKLWRPDHVAGALRRVFGTARPTTATLRHLGRLLGAWELLLASAIVLVGGGGGLAGATEDGLGAVVGGAVAVTFGGFGGFVVVAVRRGASCGCWASFTEGPAGGAELARTGVLAAAAVLVAADGWAPLLFDWTSLGWALVCLALTWLAALAGGRLAPVSSPRVARRLAMRAAPTRGGRAVARLTFLLGFVHAGTDAERRRFARALEAEQKAAQNAAQNARA